MGVGIQARIEAETEAGEYRDRAIAVKVVSSRSGSVRVEMTQN